MISLFPETIAYVQLMDPAQGRWDVTKMAYVGSFAPVNTAFLAHKGSRLTSPQDLFTGKTNIGCTGRASQSYQYPATLKLVAKMPLNIICGYDGSAASTLALLRGEVDVVSKAWNSARAEDRDSLDNGTLFPLLQAGLARTPELPNVPLAQEIVTDPSAKKAIEFVADADKRAIYIEPTPGAEVQKVSDAIIKTPKDVVGLVAKAFEAE